MGDIVERLKERREFMTAVSPYHLMDEAAAEITRLRTGVERLTRDLEATEELRAQATVKCADLTEAIYTARAEAFERAAQIADAAADRFGKHEHPYGFNVIAKDALTGIASAIRQAGAPRTMDDILADQAKHNGLRPAKTRLRPASRKKEHISET